MARVRTDDEMDAKREPWGYRVRRDTVMSTHAGLITVFASVPIHDQAIVDRLKEQGVKLDPMYED